MNSVKEFEKLWFLYKTEGEPKGMSIYDKANGILVSIQTRDGLHVRRGNLYFLVWEDLVIKREGLC